MAHPRVSASSAVFFYFLQFENLRGTQRNKLFVARKDGRIAQMEYGVSVFIRVNPRLFSWF